MSRLTGACSRPFVWLARMTDAMQWAGRDRPQACAAPPSPTGLRSVYFLAAGFFSALSAAVLASDFFLAAGLASSLSFAAAFFAGAFSVLAGLSAFSAASPSPLLAAVFLAVFFRAAFFFAGSGAEA